MYLGIDFGTSGARACVIAPGGQIEDMARIDFGALTPDEAAASWRESLFDLITQVPIGLRRRMQALAIDGTSASVICCNEALEVAHPPLMYNDARAVAEAAAIRRAACEEHPAEIGRAHV
jgi:sugar (pentulose or hexulose) kinase